MGKKRGDYPVPFILKILLCYDNPSDVLETDEAGRIVRRGQNRAPFEAGCIMRADIDRAIDALDYEERTYIVAKFVLSKTIDDGILERRALRHMANYLNGECVLRRWCRENGFEHHREILIPDELPPDLVQYIKDICIKHCVSEECPH